MPSVVKVYGLLISGLGANYVFTLLIARIIGPSNFGVYSYALNLFNIVSLISIMSLDQAALRFIPQEDEKKNHYVRIILIYSVIISSLFTISYIILTRSVFDGELKSAALAFSFLIVPISLLTVNISILQAYHILLPRMLLRYGLEPIIKIILLISFIALNLTLYPETVVGFLVLSSTITNLVILAAFRDIFFNKVKNRVANELKKISIFCTTLSVSNIVNIVASRIDLIILGTLLSNSSVGVYALSIQAAAIMAVILQGVELMYASRFSKTIGERKFSILNDEYKGALRTSVILGTPILVMFSSSPNFVASFFGEGFEVMSHMIAILCWSQFINLATGSANTILIMLGETKIVLVNSIIYALLIVLGVYFGSLHFGAIGAVWAVFMGNTCINIARVLWVYKKTRCLPYSNYLWKVIASACVPILLARIIDSDNAFGALGLPFLSLILLIALGLHREDKKTLNEIKISKLIALR